MADLHYHTIFVGNGLTSLTAAATLAKKQKSVLVLDTDDFEAHLPNPAFHFAAGPLLYFGYEKWGAMEGYFGKLAYPFPGLHEKGFSFQEVSPLLQVILPAHRVSLFSDEERYFDELKREFGQDAQKLKTLFAQISREAAYYYPFIGQFPQIEIQGMAERLNQWKRQFDMAQDIQQQQRRKATELIAPHGFSPNVLNYFQVLFLFAFKKPLAEGSAFEMIQLFSGLQKKGVRMRGGYPALVGFFQQLIRTWGGTVREKTKLSARTIQGKRVEGLILEDGTHVTGDHFIITRPSPKKTLSFCFTIPSRLIPTLMKDALLMTWGTHTPPYLEDLLSVHLNKDMESDASPGHHLIAVSILLREGVQVPAVNRETLQKKILERLHWLIPFSKSEIKAELLKKMDLVPTEKTLSQTDNPLQSTKETKRRKKDLLKGMVAYLQPKREKNVYIVDSEQSDNLGWGAPFLAGHRLAEIIEYSKK